jgi:dynein heavy chain
LWADVEREWLKLLPMMTNCPSVKHQSNVYFEFTSVDQKMRKLIKQISDMSSMRKLVDDYVDKKNIDILEICDSELKQINKTFQNFLEAKRSTYNRFYFLTDEELVSIIENVKDSRSMAKYGGYCFNCDQLDMDNELINGLQTDNEIFRLRKLMLRGEPDEMFKSISENMKSSMKFGVRNLVPKMKISTNIEQELK